MGEQFEKVDVRHRARWSESTARGVLSAWRASGMSQAGFAAREGIAPLSFLTTIPHQFLKMIPHLRGGVTGPSSTSLARFRARSA